MDPRDEKYTPDYFAAIGTKVKSVLDCQMTTRHRPSESH